MELLSKVDLLISHGGNNSVNEALAAGRPLVVLPIGGEQGDNASRINYLGVGRQVDTQRFSAEQLRAAVEEIRASPSFRERAERIGQAIAASNGPSTASRCVGRVAGSRAPLCRPEGLEPTLSPDDVQRLVDGQ